MIARRSFITGLVSLMAAPAIVRAGSLMPVKAVLTEEQRLQAMAGLVAGFHRYMEAEAQRLADIIANNIMYGNASRISLGDNGVFSVTAVNLYEFPNSGDNALGLVPATT
jgi:hypothetical protein